MRAAHRAAQQPKLWRWDVYERPYYTWDVYERPYYTWDVYDAVITKYETQTTPKIDITIPFDGGYYYTNSALSAVFNENNGKFSLSKAFTAETTTYEFGYNQNGSIPNEPGTEVGALYSMMSGVGVVKNTTLQRFEIPAGALGTSLKGVPKSYGKGASTGLTVTSFDYNGYPANGYDSVTELWYVRRAEATKTPVGTAMSFDNTTYPSYGYDAVTDLWYELRAGWTKTPTGDITWSVLGDTYPQNGYHEPTNLWYERRTG